MSTALLVATFMTLAATASPLLIAALGELVVEKSGVLNIGIDGMMLLGAVVTLLTIHATGSYPLGILAGVLAGLGAALAFGGLTVWLGVDQIVSGLALALFGVNLSELLGKPITSKPITLLAPVFPPALAEHPILKLAFGHTAPVYVALFLAVVVAWFLSKTRGGILLRATGEDHDSVHAVGYGVRAIRFGAVAFGGAMAGLAGACFPLILAPQWSDGLTSGRGWVALALVAFAAWRPGRLVVGAYLFAVVVTLEVYAKASNVRLVPAELWAALPYLATIVALVLISRRRTAQIAAPACLGKPFRP